MVPGTLRFRITCPNTTCLSFKPGGAYFVTGDRSGSLREWSAIDKLQVSLWTMNTREHISAVVVSTDGQWIVSGGTGNKVNVWSTVTRECVTKIQEPGEVRALDVSNDSTRFASGTDHVVRIFGIKSDISLVSLSPPNWSQVVGIKFSPDTCQIAVAVHSSSVVIYNTTSGDNLFNISIGGDRLPPMTPLGWSSDGRKLFVTSQGKITCFDTSRPESSDPRPEWHIQVHDKKSRQTVSAVTSGKFIACSSGSSVLFWDYTSRDQIGKIDSWGYAINCFAISHDGRRLVCADDEGITVHSLEGLIPEGYLPGILCLPLMQVSATALKSWVQGDQKETEAILSDEIAQRLSPTHDALAVCALIRTHLGEWKTALEAAEMSIKIKPSPIGQIARSIAIVGTGEQIEFDELDLVFCGCDPSDIQLLLVINSILLFVCGKRKQAISRLRRFIDSCDERRKDMYLQVLGMMYLKQEDYGNAVETLGIVRTPFTIEDRGPLMSIFIIFNWNFNNLKFIAWKHACERLYASGSVEEVGETLLKMVNPLPEDKKEHAHSQILKDIISRSSEVALLAWAGKSSTSNSCFPSSPAAYTQTSTILRSLVYEEEELRKRIAELGTIFPLVDALTIYISVTRSQPVRFAHFRLLLPCIVFHVNSLRKERENIYHAGTVGLGDVEITTVDTLPLKQPRKLVFVNPWIDRFRELHEFSDDDEPEFELNRRAGSSADADIDAELVHEPMIEEIPTPSSRTSDADVHTRALELIARLGQSFSALLLMKQPDGAYKRVAADHDIVVRGVEGNGLKDIRVEVLEVV